MPVSVKRNKQWRWKPFLIHKRRVYDEVEKVDFGSLLYFGWGPILITWWY